MDNLQRDEFHSVTQLPSILPQYPLNSLLDGRHIALRQVPFVLAAKHLGYRGPAAFGVLPDFGLVQVEFLGKLLNAVDAALQIGVHRGRKVVCPQYTATMN